MVRLAILRLAQESGHTVVTSALIEEATARFCPERGGVMDAGATLAWSGEAARLLETVGDPSVNTSIRLRAEKRARRAKSKEVMGEHVRPFLEDAATPAPVWSAAALARLARVPDMVHNPVRRRVEAQARDEGATEITVEAVEAGIAESRRVMEQAKQGGPGPGGMEPGGLDRPAAASVGKPAGGCPFANLNAPSDSAVEREPGEPSPFAWTPEAERKLERVPEGFKRSLTRQRIEAFAERHNVTTITPALLDEKYAEWAAGSAKRKVTLAWEDSALERINRIPGFVRGMVILEVERCAREMEQDTVTHAAIDRATSVWKRSGVFHSETNPDFYKPPERRS
jgi:hypothetical protein